MDLPIVLAYKTAWHIFHTSSVIDRRNTRAALEHATAANPLRDTFDEHDPFFHDDTLGVKSRPARNIAAIVRGELARWGVALREDEPLDVLVSFPYDRPGKRGVASHVLGSSVTSALTLPLAPGMLIVCEPLCFVQAATWMSQLELIEYGYELCGCYTVPERGSYIEHAQHFTVTELRAWIDAHPGIPGAHRARRALANIRDGSRSPMETAVAMMLACPRKLGGLKFRGFELNKRVDVPKEYARFTSSNYYDLDVYVARTNVTIEYNGSEHEKACRSAHDAERNGVLGMMGYTVFTLTRGQFGSQLKLRRALNAIAQSCNITMDDSHEFQHAQNELRKFVIRSWREQK